MEKFMSWNTCEKMFS